MQSAMIKPVNLIPIVLFTSIIGCVRPSLVVLTNYEKNYPKTSPAEIVLTTESTVSKPITEVGYVYARASSLEQALKEAREKAADSGGDMIIDVRAEAQVTQVGSLIFIPLYDTSYSIKGMVVRLIRDPNR
jgi:hypothetical protein